MTLSDLRDLPLLAALSEEDLARLQVDCRWTWYQPGEAVIRQGQLDTDFHMIGRGQAEALVEGEVPTRLALLGPGDFFGELAALTGGPAPATVRARELTNVLRVPGEYLMLLVDHNPALARHVITALSVRETEAWLRLHRTRLRERSLADHIARQQARTYSEWIGSGPWSQRIRAAIARGSRSLEPVVFVGEPGTGKELAAARLHYNSVRKDGPFIIVDAQDLSEHDWVEAVRAAAHGSLLLRRADTASPQVVRWAAELMPSAAGEGRGRLPGRVPRLLVTAAPVDERDPSPVEDLILDEGFAVLVPPLRDRPEDIPHLVRHCLRKYAHRSGVASLPAVSPAALRRLVSHPFSQANVRELEMVLQQALLMAAGGEVQPEHLRLSRLVSPLGRARLGLALGGGAVKGSAHIGVLRALKEAGIPVDCIAGTSAGALVGALYAGGVDVSALQEIAGRLGWMDVAEPAWPGAGFLTNRRMRAFLDRHIGPVTFDELQLPFAAVAADANTGQELVLRQGRVADAVRGSTAIPGIFKPVLVDGRPLVDGVVVNNVPAGTVRAMGADLVIAVDVTGYSFASGAPRSISEAVNRAFDIMARKHVSEALEWADVVIRPNLAGLVGYNPRNSAEFVRRGYTAAREALPAIRQRMEELRREMGL